ncbi:hypothetical protein HNR35_001035 [Borreliella spielmanii]|uniref:Uncharacterized protein n=1 Tax=Borreliella spielmanii TaxID=88916 RepID=A0ABR6P7N1_9SPIR|nr:ferrous iron transporter A [Borreliella spielmanii]MBB6032032.1 hypothetical protein [Borreliella spielmanii]
MKIKSKCLALGLLFGFISCDLFIRDEIQEKSLGLCDEESSILETSDKSVKKSLNKKGKSKVARKKVEGNAVKKDPFNHHVKSESVNNSNLSQKNVISEEEILKTKLLRERSETRKEEIQKRQDEGERILQGSLSFLSGESGELKDTIESNEIDFTIDSDLRLKSDLQAISGSNSISYTDEIEEEDYDQYLLEEDYYYDDEETRLSNRYESYLEGVKYNVSSAIKTIVKIYDNYTLLSTKQTQMYSTRLDNLAKAKAREEAKKFTKEELEKDLKTLLNYIQVSARTATNFVYAREIYSKRKLDTIETEIKNLISKIKGQSDLYEAYKAIVRPILLMKDSLKIIEIVIDKNGVWY